MVVNTNIGLVGPRFYLEQLRKPNNTAALLLVARVWIVEYNMNMMIIKLIEALKFIQQSARKKYVGMNTQ